MNINTPLFFLSLTLFCFSQVSHAADMMIKNYDLENFEDPYNVEEAEVDCENYIYVDDVQECKETKNETKIELAEDAELETEEATDPEEDRTSKVEEIIPEIIQMSKLYGYCETDEKIQSKIQNDFKETRKTKESLESLKKCRRNLKKRERIIGRINKKAGSGKTCRAVVQIKPRFVTWKSNLKNAKTVKSLKDYLKTLKKCLKKEKIQDTINTKFKKALGYGAVKAECPGLIDGNTGIVSGAQKDIFTKKSLRTCKKAARKMSRLIKKAEKNKNADTECLELPSIKEVRKCVQDFKKIKKTCKKLNKKIEKCEDKKYNFEEYGSGHCSTQAQRCAAPFRLSDLDDVKFSLKMVKGDLAKYRENKRADKKAKRKAKKAERQEKRQEKRESRKASRGK
ncbi:MAG: hypothetical protein JXQ74_03080 [Alphaproteobacteria bacterium]|nr:hypothetical protein [Alphaproteobacteria bacterium]